ncbi:CLUMA_CG008107, isoform A [Clunio marinus]|uniref:CLUMA_CG008107, isoform A n=1 Tax=Clunio marinus TaxID=568069 RepID=A0A1J1I2M9_9DIPT|nr:CLUMA_CG008107, isoform A [Clunio marinus]
MLELLTTNLDNPEKISAARVQVQQLSIILCSRRFQGHQESMKSLKCYVIVFGVAITVCYCYVHHIV